MSERTRGTTASKESRACGESIFASSFRRSHPSSHSITETLLHTHLYHPNGGGLLEDGRGIDGWREEGRD